MNKLKYVLLTVLAIAALVLSSCQSNANVSSTKKTIVVTYSVLGSVVKDLVKDKAEVIVLIPNGLDIHSWEPSAKDIEAINKADLVIQNGLDLEAGMHKALAEAQSKGVKFFTAADYITVRHIGETETEGEEHEHELEHEADSEHEHDAEEEHEHEHEVGSPDPHLWTEPLNMKSIVTALAPVLKNDLNLEVADQAKDLENRLDSLDKQIKEKVSVIPQENRKLVTGHESMGYFAQHYEFKLIGAIIPSITTQAEVSAGDLANLKHLIEENQVKAIFTQVGTSPVVAKAIGDETGVKVIELIIHQIPEDGSYFTYLTNIADTICKGLK